MTATTISNAGAYLAALSNLAQRIDPAPMDALADAVFDTWLADRQVLVFGNGGSASTAGHFVADLVKTAAVEDRRRLRAISLFDNYPLTTAIANDLDYEQSLLFPLEAYGRPGDLAIAISASGNSPNVIAACEWARAHDLRVAGLTGFEGGRLAELCDWHIHVPSDNYGLIEDLHLSVGHVLSQALKARVLREGGAA